MDNRSQLLVEYEQYINSYVFIRTEEGFGWTYSQGVEGGDLLIAQLQPSFFYVKIDSLIKIKDQIKGVTCFIQDDSIPDEYKRVAAVVMSEGVFDFGDNLCHRWRFLFGNGELSFNGYIPQLNSEYSIYGYCVVARELEQLEAL